MFQNRHKTIYLTLCAIKKKRENMNIITKEEITDSLKPINKIHIHINDLNEYAQKILKLGKSLVKKNENNELISYVLYYDNGPDIFISMVWTNPEYQGKGIAKTLILELIEHSRKEITLEVNENNPAKFLYKNLKFVEESKNGANLFMRYPRRLSIMQPYIFPYLGFFHLIESTDKIVFYDDVNYIKRGWINRNRILLNNSDFLFTIPVEKASQNKLISEIKPLIDSNFQDKFFAQIETAYKKAPYYDAVFEMLKSVFSKQYSNIADLAISSITSVYAYLDKDIQWTKSSISSPETKGMDKADRLIQINKNLGYQKYINAIGGQELYQKEYFNNKGVKLNFVQSQKVDYRQFNNEFVPWLSIIDILMFNDKKTVKEQFTAHNIV